MNHQKLTELWLKQVEQFNNWRSNLFALANQIRTKVEAILELSGKTWKDKEKNISYPYVGLIDISEDGPLTSFFSRNSITDDGELVFRLRIWFDHGLDTYPKKPYVIPLAIRYVNNEPEFSFFNRETMKGKNWTKNIDQFANSIISALTETLKFDPFDGHSKQTSIGFIQGD